MSDVVYFGSSHEAKLVVEKLQNSVDDKEDEWHVLENLFNTDRLEWADEAVFLKNEDGTILSLGLICKRYPCVVSYYTIPTYRRKSHGYTLLKACIGRILEFDPLAHILIEPTSESVDNHIELLPQVFRRRLKIR